MKYLIPFACLSLLACAPAQSIDQTSEIKQTPRPTAVLSATSGPQAPYVSDAPQGLASAIVAGGCFWCVEYDFEKLPGVIEVTSGYTGGTLDNPSYKKVSYTETGHYEAAEIIYDPSVISYRALIDHYWMTVDPTDAKGQFCDKGSSYRTAVFATPEQMADAQASKSMIEQTKPFSDPIVTPILPAVTFYDAEDYHQNYYKTNALKYKYYRNGCGRDRRLKKLWGTK